uniref:Uncharacterized protein n=1 Tax=Octopus bimaculoides TaxID=37653 RepID=A0A0L8HWU9_OCTBM
MELKFKLIIHLHCYSVEIYLKEFAVNQSFELFSQKILKFGRKRKTLTLTHAYIYTYMLCRVFRDSKCTC